MKFLRGDVQSMKDELSLSQAEACGKMIEFNDKANAQPLGESIKVRALSSTCKKGGGYIFLEWVQQLVLQMLVNGTLPSTIRLNIVT